MIVARAPMRLSFLGGTTDFPEYFLNSDVPGSVIGSTIDQYVYVTIMKQPSFEKIKFRFSWRFTESVSEKEEITHPVLRTVLSQNLLSAPLNISTMASLPGRSGLGSSSAFTVALLSAIDEVSESPKRTAHELALEAVRIERTILQEAGGWQDQFQAAVGGLRCYKFSKGGVDYSELIGNSEFRQLLSESLVLIAMGGGRDSHLHALRTAENIKSSIMEKYLIELSELTTATSNSIAQGLSAEGRLTALVNGMNLGWELKKMISSHSNEAVNQVISLGLRSGARAGKLCGAGGSGFAAFIVDPDTQTQFKQQFRSEDVVDVNLIDGGQEVFRI
jgi:D-glycero-alpha-D-manno-heptose-7-phosphate kinase